MRYWIKDLKRSFRDVKEKIVDAWYKYVLKKERPGTFVSSEVYVAMIKDEVYAVLPSERLVEVLASYGTTLEEAKIPENLSQEQLRELKKLLLEARGRYFRASDEIIEKIKSGELDCEVVLHNKWIKKKRTRRQALAIDELLEILKRIKSEPCEEQEDQEEELTTEDVQKKFDSLQIFMELKTFLIISAVIDANMQKTYEQMEALMAKAPWNQVTPEEG